MEDLNRTATAMTMSETAVATAAARDAFLATPAYAAARSLVAEAVARAMAPRKRILPSEWADTHFRLSSKGSEKVGAWRTNNNPPLREPLDSLAAHSGVHEVVLKFPIQFGKTMVAVIAIGYSMHTNPGPIMVALPSEVSMLKWIEQKLNPLLAETPVVRELLSSTNSRDGANRREFKDFAGGQLYLEHAGNSSRLKSTSVKLLLVDEIDEFAANLKTGDDPDKMLEGRQSAFPGTYKRLKISTPTLKGHSRIDDAFDKGDQRYYHVPCPHCGEYQALQWLGLHWGPGGRDVYYVCEHNGCIIREHHKTEMIAAGRWVAHNPGGRGRSYTINGLYYAFGLGPTWDSLVEEWLDAQGDPAKLKTFANDRRAESWEDPAMRAVRDTILSDRVESYPLRSAPAGVLAITAGVDTQDDRLAVQIIGWGERMAQWTLDYVELPGDPAGADVWTALVELLGTPIAHASGASLTVEATAVDAGGHRTEAVKEFARSARLRRCLAIFGATANNAPVLGKGRINDVRPNDKADRRGIRTYSVGTVAAKNWLYGRLANDHDQAAADRLCHFSADLDQFYFRGLVSETWNPRKNRFDKKRGARNEPLDTWVYAYAAAHHAELRLQRATKTDWAQRSAALQARGALAQRQAGGAPAAPVRPAASSLTSAITTNAPNAPPRPASKATGIAKPGWGDRI